MQFKVLLASTSLVGALAWMPLVPAQAQTAAALSGQDECAVLDKAAGIAQVSDILTRGAET